MCRGGESRIVMSKCGGREKQREREGEREGGKGRDGKIGREEGEGREEMEREGGEGGRGVREGKREEAMVVWETMKKDPSQSKKH